MFVNHYYKLPNYQHNPPDILAYYKIEIETSNRNKQLLHLQDLGLYKFEFEIEFLHRKIRYKNSNYSIHSIHHSLDILAYYKIEIETSNQNKQLLHLQDLGLYKYE